VLVKYSRTFKCYPFSSIFGPTSSSKQLTKGKIYLVIELYLDFESSKTSYRVLNNEGAPTIYDADGFEIVSGNLDGYYWVQDRDNYITITHKLIFEAGKNTFWEVYFDDPTDEERTLLGNVVKDLSFREGIPTPTLERREYS